MEARIMELKTVIWKPSNTYQSAMERKETHALSDIMGMSVLLLLVSTDGLMVMEILTMIPSMHKVVITMTETTFRTGEMKEAVAQVTVATTMEIAVQALETAQTLGGTHTVQKQTLSLMKQPQGEQRCSHSTRGGGSNPTTNLH